MPDPVYAGVKVLDLSTNIAGPLAAMVLGDLGADVIKIERPPQGDDTRALPPNHGGMSTVFLTFNRNKRSLMLDIRSEQGRNALLKLVETADVVIESFPPGLAEKLDLTFDVLRRRNPTIVLCSVSAFGDGKIGSSMPGYDALVQAVSGMMSFTGHPDMPPVRLAPSVLDISTGMWGVIDIMAALTRRDKERKPSHLKVALVDSAFTLMSHQVLAMLATGSPPIPLGSGAPSAVPYRVYEASDGAFMLATASDAQFSRLCEALDLSPFTDDPRFRTMRDRIDNRDVLDKLLSEIFAEKSLEYWLAYLSGAGLSVGKVNTLDDALELPVVQERSLLIDPNTINWPGGLPLIKTPLSNAPENVRPPPKLGEHSIEVLKEAGFDDKAIDQLCGI